MVHRTVVDDEEVSRVMSAALMIQVRISLGVGMGAAWRDRGASH